MAGTCYRLAGSTQTEHTQCILHDGHGCRTLLPGTAGVSDRAFDESMTRASRTSSTECSDVQKATWSNGNTLSVYASV